MSDLKAAQDMMAAAMAAKPTVDPELGSVTQLLKSLDRASKNLRTFGQQNTVSDMKLEAVVIPVSDVDRAKQFYGSLGWRLDADFVISEAFRAVQVTPPGSACSVHFGKGITTGQPGSVQGLHLVVADIEAARRELVGRGAEVSEIFHDEGGVFHHAGTAKRVPGLAPNRASYGSFASFSDPDGNGWVLQEITQRLPGR